jgi:hypothetical protein
LQPRFILRSKFAPAIAASSSVVAASTPLSSALSLRVVRHSAFVLGGGIVVQPLASIVSVSNAGSFLHPSRSINERLICDVLLFHPPCAEHDLGKPANGAEDGQADSDPYLDHARFFVM